MVSSQHASRNRADRSNLKTLLLCTPSADAPVGDASLGRRCLARAVLSCALLASNLLGRSLPALPLLHRAHARSLCRRKRRTRPSRQFIGIVVEPLWHAPV